MKVTNSKTLTTQNISSCTEIISPSLRKTVYISGISIEKYSIVEWDDVKDVAEQIDTFVNNGGIIIEVRRKQD
jgi:hypothetical protein